MDCRSLKKIKYQIFFILHIPSIDSDTINEFFGADLEKFVFR